MQAQVYSALTNVYKTINDNTVDHQAIGAKLINLAFANKEVAIAA